MAHDSQIIRAKENLKLSHGGSSYRKASGTNPPLKALRQSSHRVWGLTHRRAIKEKTIAYITFYYLFELIAEIRFSNNSFEFIN